MGSETCNSSRKFSQFRSSFRAHSEHFQSIERNNWGIALKLGIHLEGYPSSGTLSEQFQGIERNNWETTLKLVIHWKSYPSFRALSEHFQSSFRVLKEIIGKFSETRNSSEKLSK